jgi:hypothetical protein
MPGHGSQRYALAQQNVVSLVSPRFQVCETVLLLSFNAVSAVSPVSPFFGWIGGQDVETLGTLCLNLSFLESLSV